MPVPDIGRIVRYRLTEEDVRQINRRRTSSQSIRDRINEGKWPLGAQAHMGAEVNVGDELPLIITEVKPLTICGQVLLNGNDVLWVRDIQERTPNMSQSGVYYWPERR